MSSNRSTSCYRHAAVLPSLSLCQPAITPHISGRAWQAIQPTSAFTLTVHHLLFLSGLVPPFFRDAASLHIPGERTRKSASGAGRLDRRGQYDPSESGFRKGAIVVFRDISPTGGLMGLGWTFAGGTVKITYLLPLLSRFDATCNQRRPNQ
jgi:hypothetical protein